MANLLPADRSENRRAADPSIDGIIFKMDQPVRDFVDQKLQANAEKEGRRVGRSKNAAKDGVVDRE